MALPSWVDERYTRMDIRKAGGPRFGLAQGLFEARKYRIFYKPLACCIFVTLSRLYSRIRVSSGSWHLFWHHLGSLG